jgi:hypothetical protein
VSSLGFCFPRFPPVIPGPPSGGCFGHPGPSGPGAAPAARTSLPNERKTATDPEGRQGLRSKVSRGPLAFPDGSLDRHSTRVGKESRSSPARRPYDPTDPPDRDDRRFHRSGRANCAMGKGALEDHISGGGSGPSEQHGESPRDPAITRPDLSHHFAGLGVPRGAGGFFDNPASGRGPVSFHPPPRPGPFRFSGRRRVGGGPEVEHW